MPALYVCSFLFRASEEVHRIGGHVMDKTIRQRFAKRLLQKVCACAYLNIISLTVSILANLICCSVVKFFDDGLFRVKENTW